MMATPKKKGLFRRLRTALSISKAARVAPAINLAAQLDEAVGIEGIDAVRQSTNLDGEDAAAVKRWARRLRTKPEGRRRSTGRRRRGKAAELADALWTVAVGSDGRPRDRVAGS